MSVWVTGYFKLWKLEPTDDGKGLIAQLSSSHKATEWEKQHGSKDYVLDFSMGYVRFKGNALAKAQKLVGNETIHVTKATMTYLYNAEKKKPFASMQISDFDMPDDNNYNTSNRTQNAKKNDGFMDIPEGEDEELPFQ